MADWMRFGESATFTKAEIFEIIDILDPARRVLGYHDEELHATAVNDVIETLEGRLVQPDDP